jgi:hypothetical protein
MIPHCETNELMLIEIVLNALWKTNVASFFSIHCKVFIRTHKKFLENTHRKLSIMTKTQVLKRVLTLEGGNL